MSDGMLLGLLLLGWMLGSITFRLVIAWMVNR